jgi:AraC-like DNA-binding protein
MPSPDTLRRLGRARDLLGERLGEPVTLADAAAEAGLSPWHFLRTFRAAFGETPHAFLTRLRLARARHLLATTDRSVTDVCLDVGFSSLGSFSHLFTRTVGVSPSAYRRRLRRSVAVPGTLPWLLVPFCFAVRLGGPSPKVSAAPQDPSSHPRPPAGILLSR